MRAREFWKIVSVDEVDVLDRLTSLLAQNRVRYCVIGGQAVNAYVEPLVSLDLDLAVAADAIEALEAILMPSFDVERSAHSLNVSRAGSDLRVQFHLDARYSEFVARASELDVLGMRLAVAAVEDVLQSKVWAALDATRRPSKRQKDLADVARLLEAYPHLRGRVPAELLARLV